MAPRGPRIIGINGPQGCGKTTIAAALVERARASGEVAVALSIDDFYLTHAAQRALAARYAGNRLLEHRGYPGTHDVALGDATLRALRGAAPGAIVPLPAYDKSAHRGRGDRTPRGAWPVIKAPVDLVVLEGWMLGFPPVDAEEIAAAAPDPLVRNALAVAAGFLPAYRAWHRHLDAFVHLEASCPADIVRWRVDAEHARRAAGLASLSDDEARDYVERFLPAYALWVPALRARPPSRDGAALPSLWARLGADRSPQEIRLSPSDDSPVVDARFPDPASASALSAAEPPDDR